MLEVKEISKNFGGNKVLKNVTFSVEKGEILGIVGPNGSGKTTLLNVISGIVVPDKGDILLEGRSLVRIPLYKRARIGIGRTFQITRLFENLSVLENVMIPLYYGSPLKAEKEVAYAILESVGLFNKKEELAGSLSLAQRKRLELARALALSPKILLLDEIFAGLNPVSIKEIVELILNMNAEKGITVILVEHVLKALFQLTERVVVLSEGKLIFDGNPQDMAKNEEVIKAYLGEKYNKGVGCES